MALGSSEVEGNMLPPSRITNERVASLPRKFMPAAPNWEALMLGKTRPVLQYPHRSVFSSPLP
uniref:Uncharacterized protein n=1 Tax=Oryza punctata TaxID=4537 RepID=A0A0E0MF30_ORYPU